MKKKIVGILVMTLLIATAVLPIANAITINNEKNVSNEISSNKIIINDVMSKKSIFYPTDDTYITHGDPDWNGGTETKLTVRNEYGVENSPGWAADSLIKFDLSSIPSDSKITSAKLELYYIDNYDFPPATRELNLYRINENWDENTVTWDTQPVYSGYPSASAEVPLSTGNWMSWDVTYDIIGFVKGSIYFYGWKITDDNLWGHTEIPMTYFCSKEYGDFTPKLSITISNSKDTPNNPLITGDKWMKTFGGKSYDAGVSALQTSDGGYIVLGCTGSYGEVNGDFWLIKTDSSGNKIWDKTFGGKSYELPFSLEITSDGGYIMLGVTNSYGAGMMDLWLIKTDSDGNKIWDKTFGYEHDDWGYEVKQTNDGGYILTGIVDFTGTNTDIWLIKTDSDGNKIWDKTFGGTAYDEGYSVKQTTDGGYIILGEIGYDICLIKTDSNGEIQWDKKYNRTGFNRLSYIQQTTDGGYILVGSNFNEVTHTDIWVVKTDGNGEIIWEKTFTTIGENYGYSIQQTKDGGYIILGDTIGSKYGNKYNALLIKTDSNGAEIWRKTYGGPYTDEAISVQQTTDGGYILTGAYTPKLLGFQDLWLVKTDANGNAPNSYARNTIKTRLFELFPYLFKVLEKFLEI